MTEFELMTDPRFPLIHEALRTLNQLLLVVPKLADSILLFSQTMHELVPLAKCYLAFKVVSWLFPAPHA